VRVVIIILSLSGSGGESGTVLGTLSVTDVMQTRLWSTAEVGSCLPDIVPPGIHPRQIPFLL
jgi:hypothetical protein